MTHSATIRASIRAALDWRAPLGAAAALTSAVLLPSAAVAQEQNDVPNKDLTEIVVTGRRAALENATERKKHRNPSSTRWSRTRPGCCLTTASRKFCNACRA